MVTRFSFYEPTPVVNKKSIAVNSELNESIEVEVDTSVFNSQCDGSFSPASYGDTTGSAMKSYDSDDRVMYDNFSVLQGSGKKSSPDSEKEFSVRRTDTVETSTETMDEGENEDSTDDADDTDANRNNEDEYGSIATEYMEEGMASLTEEESPEVEGIKDEGAVAADAVSDVQEDKLINATKDGPKVENIADECVVVLDANAESKDGTEDVGESKTLASFGDKLSEMMRDRIQAINSIRGLLEREQEHENDVVFELSNEVKILRHDLACKGQANKELMKTVTYLKTKNQDYAQQMSKLSSTVDELVMSQKITIEQMSVLEEGVSDKSIIIDLITAEMDNKNILLEEKTAENAELADHLQCSKAENDGLKAAIQDLVTVNEDNIKQMTILEDDVAAKKSMIDEMSKDINQLSTTCKEKAAEITELDEQLELYKVESDRLKAAVQDLESKNTSHASELENLVTSIHEIVELNGELQAQVEQVNDANDELDKLNKTNEEKNAELLDVVECLTQSLNAVRMNHEKEKEVMKNMVETEKENNAAIVRKLEETLEDVTARMTAEMLAQKASLEGQIANLLQSLDEATVHRKDASSRNKELQMKIQEVKKSATKSYEGLAGAIGQLEKDVEEEFQITTQLKNGSEKLIMKLGNDKNSHYVNDVEDILGNVRMIQCWQLSHFQLINNLATENKDHVRSIQLL